MRIRNTRSGFGRLSDSKEEQDKIFLAADFGEAEVHDCSFAFTDTHVQSRGSGPVARGTLFSSIIPKNRKPCSYSHMLLSLALSLNPSIISPNAGVHLPKRNISSLHSNVSPWTSVSAPPRGGSYISVQPSPRPSVQRLQQQNVRRTYINIRTASGPFTPFL